MKNTASNLNYRIKFDKIDHIEALIELEKHVRTVDMALEIELVSAAERVAKYETYDKLRRASCLLTDVLNDLHGLNKDS